MAGLKQLLKNQATYFDESPKAKLVLVILLAVSVIGAGAGLVVHQVLVAKARGEKQPDAPQLAAQGAATPLTNQPSHVRADLYGDALPPGALVRMGTIRLRHPTLPAAVAFSADGTTLVSANPEGIRFFEAATGKRLQKNTSERPGGGTFHLSPDGKIFLTRHESELRLLDVNAGQELRRFPVSRVFTTDFAWTADSKTLAAATYDGQKSYAVQPWDVDTGHPYPVLDHTDRIYAIALSPDGRVLASGDAKNTLRLFEISTGRELRKVATTATGLTFFADGKALASGDRTGTVKFWDVATGQERGTVSAPAVGTIAILCFSPDGRTLAVRGNKGLSLCDVRTHKERHHLPVTGGVRFAPDGNTLVSQSGGRIQLWDVASGQAHFDRPGHYAAVDSVVFSLDGRVLASSSSGDGDPMIWLWESRTGKAIFRLEGEAPSASSDGKLLLSVGHDGIIRFWDRSTGKEVRQFALADVEGSSTRPRCATYRLSSDRSRLVAISVVPRPGVMSLPYQVDVWDTATGNLLAHRRFMGPPPLYVSPRPRLSGDARRVTVRTANGFAIKDVATGRELLTLQVELGLGSICSSADGRFLATPLLARGAAGGFGGADAIGVWELASGNEFLRLETGLVGPIAFSPDGRLLAAAGQEVMSLWDIATGEKVFQVQLPPDLRSSDVAKASLVSSLLFSPDGKTVATGFVDGSILIWDVAPANWRTGFPGKHFEPEDLERLWADLAAEDGRKAQATVWSLVAAPQTTVRFLKQKVQPAPKVPLERMHRLLADLDSAIFAIRETASHQVEQLGELAESSLRQALEENPSAETRKRIDALLARPLVVQSREVLRRLRAIQVLEGIGSEEASQALEALSSGATGARETQEASEAFKRLAARIAARP